MKDIDDIAGRLAKLNTHSKLKLVQDKTRKALADIKRARTLLDKAEQTAVWAEYYDRSGSAQRCPVDQDKTESKDWLWNHLHHS